MKVASKLFIGGALLSCVAFSTHAADLLQPQRIRSHANQLSVKMVAVRGSAKISDFGQVNGLFLYGIRESGKPTLLPPVLALKENDKLDVELENRLPCDNNAVGLENVPLHITNLHMHGFIVSPNDKSESGYYGDYVLASVFPKKCPPQASVGHMHHHGAGSADAPSLPVEVGKIHYRYQLPPDHPRGLSWYHPHIHGTSGTQVSGGLAGLVSIGSPWDYTYVYCSLSDSAASDVPKCVDTQAIKREQRARRNTDERVMLLKDFQVSWQAEKWQYNPNFDQVWCGGNPVESSKPGVCENPETPSNRWLFTLNGQLAPTVHVPSGRHQIWRLANMSANVTHLLQLSVRYNNRDYVVPLQQLAQDGVSIPSHGAPNVSSEFLMMPAARAELLVDTASVCRAIGLSPCRINKPLIGTLKTLGMAKEAGALPATGADRWPPMTLAKVIFEPGSATSVDPGYSLSVIASPFHQLREFATKRSLSAPPSKTLSGLDQRCIGGEAPTTLTSEQYRLIGLKNDTDSKGDEYFHMAYSEIHPIVDGQRDFEVNPKEYRKFKMDGPPSICVGANIKGKYQEIWVIKNDSTEIHNFHLHQAKFEVLDSQTGKGLIKQGVPGANKFVDVYPVDAKGWIKIRLTFDHREQIGTYVYHCHILEHEDRGMMSLIQVIDVSQSGM